MSCQNAIQPLAGQPEMGWTVFVLSWPTSGVLGRTKTAQFRRWFGESRVVDEAGKPAVVYHGATVEFREFARQPGGDAGFHFATCPRQAAVRVAGQPGRMILPVFLSIQNPKRMRDKGHWTAAQIKNARRAGYDGIVYLNRYEGLDPAHVLRAHKAGINPDSLSDAEFRRWFPEARDSWIAFEAGQIKSIYNAGGFSPDSADILG